MRTGSRRVISAMCAEFLPQVRPLSGTPAGGWVPIARWLFVAPAPW